MRTLWLVTVAGVLGLAGCTGAKAGKPGADEVKVREALARLDPGDRRLAEAQQFCAVETENPLGSMGTPVKVMVKDQPVFLCCKGCRKRALEDPEATLARVRELKAKAAGPPGK
jgi:hypothetical protein